jgi:hypothetical protein
MPFESNKFFDEHGQANKERREKFLIRERFLNLRHLPAMMNPEETALYLGCLPHDIPILVAHGLLKPLGNPVQSSVKFFAKVVLDELRNDVEWLHRAKGTIQGHWSMKNARRSGNAEFSSLPEKARPLSRRSTAARALSK